MFKTKVLVKRRNELRTRCQKMLPTCRASCNVDLKKHHPRCALLEGVAQALKETFCGCLCMWNFLFSIQWRIDALDSHIRHKSSTVAASHCTTLHLVGMAGMLGMPCGRRNRATFPESSSQRLLHSQWCVKTETRSNPPILHSSMCKLQ